MIVAVHSVVIAMPSYDRRKSLHRFSKRFCKSCIQPRFCRLFLRFQLLLACTNAQSVFSCSCLGVVKGESEEIKVFICSFESAYRQYPRLFLCCLKTEFFKPRLKCLHYFLCLIFILEQYQEIVCVSHVICLSPKFRLYRLFKPKVKHIMQIYICQNRRDKSALCREKHYAELM